MIKDILAIVRNEDVVEAIVVVVADGNGGRPTRALQTRLGRDVGEGTVTIVFVEAIGRTRRCSFQARAAEHKQIYPAIIVIVDERHSASDHLNDVTLAIHAPINDGLRETCLFGNVGHAGQKWTTGGLSTRLCFHAARRDALAEGSSRHGGTGGCDHGSHHFAAGDHGTASVTFSIWPAFTFSSLCTIPEGHRISTSFAVESAPSPTMSRLSLADW